MTSSTILLLTLLVFSACPLGSGTKPRARRHLSRKPDILSYHFERHGYFKSAEAYRPVPELLFLNVQKNPEPKVERVNSTTIENDYNELLATFKRIRVFNEMDCARDRPYRRLFNYSHFERVNEFYRNIEQSTYNVILVVLVLTIFAYHHFYFNALQQ